MRRPCIPQGGGGERETSAPTPWLFVGDVFGAAAPRQDRPRLHQPRHGHRSAGRVRAGPCIHTSQKSARFKLKLRLTPTHCLCSHPPHPAQLQPWAPARPGSGPLLGGHAAAAQIPPPARRRPERLHAEPEPVKMHLPTGSRRPRYFDAKGSERDAPSTRDAVDCCLVTAVSPCAAGALRLTGTYARTSCREGAQI